jgi:hypothetical protein
MDSFCFAAAMDGWDQALAALKPLGQKLLGALSPLLLLLLNLAEEVGEVLIASRVAGVLLVEVRPLQGMVEYADQIVLGIAGARVVGHDEPPLMTQM